MRSRTTIVLSMLVLQGWAQFDVPARVELNSADPAQRQVIGLADPIVADAGMSVEAVRSNATTYAEAAGTLNLTASLVPAPSGYAIGMLVSILPAMTNDSGATLDLNGLGPRPIVKGGGLPLDSADMHAGVLVRMVYDGTGFQVLGSSYIPCPKGFRIGAREYCIEDSSRTAQPFMASMAFCVDLGARLCSLAEWMHACRSDPGFVGTISSYEWVDHAANNTIDAKRVGLGEDGSGNVGIGCDHGATAAFTALSRFRCCLSR